MVIAPFVTVLTRKFGIHRIMCIGVVFQCGGFISASFATNVWHLHISQGVLVGCGVGFLYIPALPILSQWFLKKRSLANGISAAGSGVGGAALPVRGPWADVGPFLEEDPVEPFDFAVGLRAGRSGLL